MTKLLNQSIASSVAAYRSSEFAFKSSIYAFADNASQSVGVSLRNQDHIGFSSVSWSQRPPSTGSDTIDSGTECPREFSGQMNYCTIYDRPSCSCTRRLVFHYSFNLAEFRRLSLFIAVTRRFRRQADRRNTLLQTRAGPRRYPHVERRIGRESKREPECIQWAMMLQTRTGSEIAIFH